MPVKKLLAWDDQAADLNALRTTKTQVVWEPNGTEVLRMSKEKATLAFVAQGILADEHPMTVRQVCYQLFSQGWIDNSEASYRQVVGALKDARQHGIIPWEHVEDRTRQPRKVQQFDDLPSFLDTVRKAYRRDVWQNQGTYLEVWLEKDALSGIFEDELHEYGVTLNVGKGYAGWSSPEGHPARRSLYGHLRGSPPFESVAGHLVRPHGDARRRSRTARRQAPTPEAPRHAPGVAARGRGRVVSNRARAA